MRLIKPSFEIWDQQEGLEGMQTHIERCGRVCYKSSPKYRWYSEDKKRWINEDSEEWKAIENPKKEYPTRGENISAKPFVDRMIKSGHGAMLEHGTVYLKLNNSMSANVFLISQKYDRNKYSVVNYRAYENDVNNRGVTYQEYFITTNYRVLVENNWMNDLQYLCEPTEFHEKRVTVKFICDRGVSHEFVRHRVMSFAQESTRYCNYSKDKFNNCVTYILPNWCTKVNIEDYEKNPKLIYNANGTLTSNEISFLCGLYDNEKRYLELLENGWTPQQARAVLPNSLKTELVMTGFAKDWEHFFKLRDAGSAHPQARELAQPLHEEFIDRNYIV